MIMPRYSWEIGGNVWWIQPDSGEPQLVMAPSFFLKPASHLWAGNMVRHHDASLDCHAVSRANAQTSRNTAVLNLSDFYLVRQSVKNRHRDCHKFRRF
ncbi:hypothetical protein VTO42DRAFT_3768 [Malbranchea cinnamomea]